MAICQLHSGKRCVDRNNGNLDRHHHSAKDYHEQQIAPSELDLGKGVSCQGAEYHNAKCHQCSNINAVPQIFQKRALKKQFPIVIQRPRIRPPLGGILRHIHRRLKGSGKQPVHGKQHNHGNRNAQNILSDLTRTFHPSCMCIIQSFSLHDIPTSFCLSTEESSVSQSSGKGQQRQQTHSQIYSF